MAKFNQAYNDKVNLVQDLYSFHPEYFAKLSEQDQELLSGFYFADREVDVENIFEYREVQIEKKPTIESAAEKAYSRLLEVAEIKS